MDNQYSTDFFDQLLNFLPQTEEQPQEDIQPDEQPSPYDQSEYDDLNSRYEELSQRLQNLESNPVPVYEGDDDFLNYIFSDNSNDPIDISYFQPQSQNQSDVSLKTKPTADISNLNMDLKNFASNMSGTFPGLVISSGNDSKHMKGSKHYQNKALDFGANSSDPQAYKGFKNYLKANPSIKKQYGIEDIIDEGDHMHVELKQFGGYIDDVSKQGYNSDSPYNNQPFLDINTPTGNITLENTPHPLLGIDEYNNMQYMQPGNKYKFPGKKVREIPLFQNGGIVGNPNEPYHPLTNPDGYKSKIDPSLLNKLKGPNPSNTEFNRNITRGTSETGGNMARNVLKYFTGANFNKGITQESPYKPTTSVDPNSTYYTWPYLRNDVMKDITGDTYVSNVKSQQDNFAKQRKDYTPQYIKDKTFDEYYNYLSTSPKHVTPSGSSINLGHFQITPGKDKSGRYISIYDKYDWNLLEGLGMKGNSWETYDRIYENEWDKLKDVTDKKSNKFQYGGSRCGEGFYFDYREGKCLPLKGNNKFNVDIYQSNSDRSFYDPYNRTIDFNPENGNEALLHETAHAEQDRNGELSSFSSVPMNKDIYDLLDPISQSNFIYDRRNNDINNGVNNFAQSFKHSNPNRLFTSDMKALSPNFKRYLVESDYQYDIPNTEENDADKRAAQELKKKYQTLQNTIQLNFR